MFFKKMNVCTLSDKDLPSDVQKDVRAAESITGISLQSTCIEKLRTGVAGQCNIITGEIKIDPTTVANDNHLFRKEVLTHEAWHKVSHRRGDNAHYISVATEEGINTITTKQTVGSQHCYFSETAMIQRAVAHYNAHMRTLLSASKKDNSPGSSANSVDPTQRPQPFRQIVLLLLLPQCALQLLSQQR